MSPARLVLQLGLFAFAAGGGVAAFLVLSKAESPAASPEELASRGRRVKAISIARQDYDTPIVGFGTARSPAIQVVRPQVSGSISRGSLSPEFRDGRPVERDQVLFRIDDREFRAVLDRNEAGVREIECLLAQIEARLQPYDRQIAILDREAKDLEEVLAIHEETVALAQKSADREKSSYEKGAGTLAAWETALLEWNQLKEAAARTRTRANQIPGEIELRRAERDAVLAERAVLEAKKAVALASAARAKLDLDRTEVKCPESGTVLLTDPETGRTVKPLREEDWVAPGQDLGWILQAKAGLEIAVDVELSDLLLLRLAERAPSGGIRIATLSDLADRSAGEVEVAWQEEPRYAWKGRIARIRGELDAATRTVTVVVLVEDPGSEFERGRTFPLTAGMFCKVSIPAEPHPAAVVIPRSALREGGTVHVVERGALAIRRIEVVRRTEDRVVVGSGLEAGDVLILSDIPGAIPGIPIDPVFAP